LRLTGKRLNWTLGPEREADHRVYITDMSKFRRDYPGWDLEVGLEQIFHDLVGWVGRTVREARA